MELTLVGGLLLILAPDGLTQVLPWARSSRPYGGLRTVGVKLSDPPTAPRFEPVGSVSQPQPQPWVIYPLDRKPFLSFEARSRPWQQDRQQIDRLVAHRTSLGINPDLIP
jgi:hypothetical protein